MSFPYDLPLVLDGATGTNLQKAGMPVGVCTEAWILEHPQAIIDLKRSYVEAGSDAVYAPTFGVNRPSLEKHGVKMVVRELCLRLVDIARSDVGGDVLLGGDMAPCGLIPAPFGETSFNELVDIFAEQAAALEEAEVDFFVIETQINLEEARAAVTAVRGLSSKPVFVSFTCNDAGKSFWGDDLAEAAAVLEPLGIDAYGVNCCGDLALLGRLLSEIRAKTRLPLIAKPNAGFPEMRDGKPVYHMTPSELARHIPALISAGAGLIGGCCGTGAGHIGAIAKALGKDTGAHS